MKNNGKVIPKSGGAGIMGTSGRGNKVISLFFFFLAGACLVFWLSALVLSIQTSESVFGAPQVTSLQPNLVVLTQPYDFALGGLASSMLAPVMVAWPVALFELVFVFAYEYTVLHARKFNTKIGGMVPIVCAGAFIYDFLTNLGSPLVPGGFGNHFVFALVITAVLIVAPIALVVFIKLGVDEW